MGNKETLYPNKIADDLIFTNSEKDASFKAFRLLKSAKRVFLFAWPTS